MDATGSFPLQIETERTQVAIYAKDDGAAFYRLLQENADFLRAEMYEVEALQSIADADTYVNEMIVAWQTAQRFVPKIVARETDEMIGQLWIEPRWEEDIFEIGYFIVEQHQGKGLVSEAVNAAVKILFTNFATKALKIETKATNTRSIRLAERCGFTFTERILQYDPFGRQEPVEMLHFHLWREAYLAQKLGASR